MKNLHSRKRPKNVGFQRVRRIESFRGTSNPWRLDLSKERRCQSDVLGLTASVCKPNFKSRQGYGECGCFVFFRFGEYEARPTPPQVRGPKGPAGFPARRLRRGKRRRIPLVQQVFSRGIKLDAAPYLPPNK